MEINWLENIAYRVERSVNRLRFELRADFYRLLIPCFVSFEKSTDFFLFFFLTTTTSNYPYEKQCQSRTNESIITMKENGSRDTAFQRLWRTAESKEARRKKDRSGGKNMGIGGQDISEGPVPRTWWSSSPPPPPHRRLQNGKKRGRTKTVARRIDAAAGIPRNDICSPLFRVLCHEGTTSFCPWFSASLLFSIARR